MSQPDDKARSGLDSQRTGRGKGKDSATAATAGAKAEPKVYG